VVLLDQVRDKLIELSPDHFDTLNTLHELAAAYQNAALAHDCFFE
jgi:hypothetical protein